MHTKTDILGVQVSAVSPGIAQEEILGWIKNKENVYVCVAPVSTLVDANRSGAYRQIINGAAMVTPDGMPVVWILKTRGLKQAQRTYGPDLMKVLCANSGLKHFFFGGTQETLDSLQQCLKNSYIGINIVGRIAPPFRTKVQIEDEQIIRQINASGADILWVGLGSPKQDEWMALHRSRIKVPVMIGVGAAFDFVSGVKRQAPKWMQRSGLEWLFRLCCEPKRLWKRYLIGNSLFILYLIKDALFKRNR